VCPLAEPLDAGTARTLRRAVLDFRTSERRRLVAPVLHVGEPGAVEQVFAGVGAGPMDQALRADVIGAMLRHSMTSGRPPPLVWLTRSGGFTLHDAEAAWLPAALTAYAEAALPLTMVVITRQGWWDPCSDLRRVWKRLRAR
jgi:hypothetical protein